MIFFNRYINKMRRGNCIAAILLFLLFCGIVAGTVFFAANGHNREAIAFGILSAIILVLTIKGLRDAIHNPKFRKFMASIESMGSAELLGEQLSAIQRCELAEGDLRFNEKYFFYSAGDTLFLLRTKDIYDVRPICVQSRYKHYYVLVSGKGESIQIGTTEHCAVLLAQNIWKAIETARMRKG